MMLHEKKRVGVPDIIEAKGKEKISCLTAYDYQFGRILDACGVDILLVGDSLEMVFRGKESTVSATLERMVYHGEMVSRAAKRSLTVIDMPFGTYHSSKKTAVENCVYAIRESGCTAVKVEGGERMASTIEAIVNAQIPVFAHIGLTPQSINILGSYKKQRCLDILLRDAKSVCDAGAFAVVLEMVDDEIASEITEAIAIPTIGIGSGTSCDGQVLVINDILSLSEFKPSFARVYAEIDKSIRDAVCRYVEDVRKS